MAADLRAEQNGEWRLLYDRIREILQRYGEEDDGGTHNDYLLVDENLGLYKHRIETDKLQFAQPVVIKLLRELLVGFPNWEIVVALGGSYGGVVIRDDEIVDALKRENLPEELRAITYEGSRPLGSKFHDIMHGADLLKDTTGQ